jgi:hypothetical protein
MLEKALATCRLHGAKLVIAKIDRLSRASETAGSSSLLRTVVGQG